MRGFAWVCIVVGVLLAIAVPIKAEREVAVFVGSAEYRVWIALKDKRAWRPAGLRSAVYWDEKRWPAAIGGGATAAFGILLLAIRRPEQERRWPGGRGVA
jgi:hypothetical protein